MLIVLFGIVPIIAYSQGMKLPVFYLKYDGALGSEETEEESIEQASNRHTLSLRVKEEFGKRFTANLLTLYSRKVYLLQAGSYWYFFVNPYMTFDITDKIRWENGFRSKWIFYDEMDSDEKIKDYTNILRLISSYWAKTGRSDRS